MTPEAVALRLGMVKHANNRWSPCPACGSKTRSDESRPCVRISKYGFHCNACHAKGDVYRMASHGLGHGGETKGRIFPKLKAWVEGTGSAAVGTVEEEERQWKRIDPMPALRCAVPLSRVVDPKLTAWLERRHISRSAPAGWLPRWRSEWWPWPVGRYPVVLPACTGAGAIESMHAIDIESGEKRWPKGASSGALLFASRQMRDWLAGRAAAPKEVVITEGAPDFLSYASDYPTLGVSSGGEHALRTVNLRGVAVFMGTHLDENHAGESLEARVAEAIFPAVLRRLPYNRVSA